MTKIDPFKNDLVIGQLKYLVEFNKLIRKQIKLYNKQLKELFDLMNKK